MRKLRKRSYLLFVLPALHLALCLTIVIGGLSQHTSTHAGGFLWFPVFLLDYPASILLMRVALGSSHDVMVLTIGGTLWWLLISIIIGRVFSLIASLFRRNPAKSRASAPRIQ